MGTKMKDANSLRYCIGGGTDESTLWAGPLLRDPSSKLILGMFTRFLTPTRNLQL